MARQIGLIKFKGKLEGLSGYKTKDGYLLKTASGVEADRIANDPAFQRTRENGSEFGRGANGGKLIRVAFRSLLQNVADPRVTSRLTAKMIEAIKLDATSVRGERNVLDGEIEILEDFNFNIASLLSTTLYAPYTPTINRETGAHVIDLPGFVPGNSIAFPAGATHCKITAGAAAIDFENETYDFATATSDFIVLGPQNEPALNLPVALPAASTHPVLLVLGLEFYQQVNAQMYTLKNGAYNALAIVAVNSGV